MSVHLSPVVADLEVQIGGRARHRVIALAWDEDKNVVRYLIVGKERPVWVLEQEISATFPAPATG